METLAPPVAPAVAAPVPNTASRRARLRALARLDWWPRAEAQDAAPIPMWVHVLLVLVLLLFDVLMYYAQVQNPKVGIKFNATWVVRNIALDVLTAGLFYWNWLVLIPRTLARNRVGWYVLGVVVAVVVANLLRLGTSNLVYKLMDAERPDVQKHFWPLMFTLSLLALSTIMFSSGLRVTLDYLRGQRKRRDLERQQLLTELAMLKTQINPHFLFNTLNNIYSLTSRKSDKAPEAVLRLAEIMRYLLYDSSTDTVPLSRELDHLRSFLDLQRLRLPASAPDVIRLDLDGAPPSCALPIAPLLLMPLVENAFKHGDLAARPVAVHLTLTLAPDGYLRFSVLNYIAPPDTGRELPEQVGGVGLVNLRRRLELLYPHRHTLEVEQMAEQYRVTLTLLT